MAIAATAGAEPGRRMTREERKVIIASSETTYGVCFAEGDKDFKQFPLEEDYDVDPQDSYGLSKVCNEKTARAFAMRYGADIYALRIGNVIEPHEYGPFAGYAAEPMTRKRNAWSYIDARDLGEIAGRRERAIERDPGQESGIALTGVDRRDHLGLARPQPHGGAGAACHHGERGAPGTASDDTQPVHSARLIYAAV